MELFSERGYDRVTVGEIAARAGLTERTFFRYFTDKREVLFSGSDMLVQALTKALTEAPADESPMEAVGSALDAIARALEAHRTRDEAKVRYGVVTAHPELMERERAKMSKLVDALTVALHKRGVEEPAASLVAEAGIAVFRVGFERWLEDEHDVSMAEHMQIALKTLQQVTAPSVKPRKKR